MKHKLLLMHDDDESLLRSLANSFRAEGFEVVLVESAQEAVEKSEAGETDLLLMKLDSRTDEGWEAIDEITEENPLLPIIVITSYPDLRNLAEASGACALVEMPVDVTALLQTIRELLADPARRRLEQAGNRPVDFQHVAPAGGAFREQLKRGYTTPYRFSTAAPRWGLNE